MKNGYFRLVVALVLACSFLAACSSTPASPTTPATAAPAAPETIAPTATSASFVITDALNRTVSFDTPPQRIVIAGKATPLLLDSFYMFPEASSRLVGYEMRMQNGDSFLKVIDPTLSAKTKLQTKASAEQIAPTNPDLVILKTYMADTLGKTLEAIGIKVVYVDMETPESFYSDIRNLGAILGDNARAEEIVNYYQGKTQAISDKVASLAPDSKPSVLLLEYSSKDNAVSFSVPPVAYLQTLMVSSTGGNPVWSDAAASSDWNIVSMEQIVKWNPDMIFIVDYSGKAVEDIAALKTNSEWAELRAVKADQLYAFPTDFLSWDQPDSRWILGMTWAAAKEQPKLFPDIKITDELTQFYKSMYNLDDKTINEQILPLFKGS